MQRDDGKIPGGGGRCNEWKELRCRNRTHFGIFGAEAALNKTKGGTRSSTRWGKPIALEAVTLAPLAIGSQSSSEKPIHLCSSYLQDFAKL